MRTPVVAVAIFLLAACSSADEDTGSASDTGASTSDPSSAAPSGPADGSVNERGNVEKALGEEIQYPPDNPVITIVFDSVTPDVECTSNLAQAPEHGHFLGVEVRVSTEPNLDQVAPGFGFSAADFTAIGPDGITVPGLDTFAAYSCIDSTETGLPNLLGAGQQYEGVVVLDSPHTGGILVFQPLSAPTAVEVPF